VERLVGRYLYVDGLGWHEWVGDRWSGEVQVPVRHAVQQMIIRNRSEAKSMITGAESNESMRSAMEELAVLKESRGDAGPGQRETELQELADRTQEWVEQWESYSSWWYGLANGHDFTQVMKFVESDPGKIFITASQLDSNPNLLNCSNGTVDLRTGEIRRHDPADFITKSTRVPFDPKSQHPMWDKAREAFAPGTEGWLQLKVGEGAFGYPSNDDTMLFSFGNGSNGKSTLSDAILNALGDYAVFLHDKAVLGADNDHGTEKMVLRGARWGVLEELPEAQVLRPAIIKKLIGTSKITARLMRQNNVTFNATHSLLVNSNHRPQVLENDRGTWRRLIAVPWPWTFKFTGEELEDDTEFVADPAVKASLSRDIEVQKAALAWIVEGARQFTEAGDTCGPLPAVVLEETQSWRRESDTFGTFFEQELTAERGYAVSSKELLEVYNNWLMDLGKKPVSDTHVRGRLSTMKEARKVLPQKIKRSTKSYRVSVREPLSALPAQFAAWTGLRWKTEPEQAETAI
jgi:P4 family phage/plasmid primase-like protien